MVQVPEGVEVSDVVATTSSHLATASDLTDFLIPHEHVTRTWTLKYKDGLLRSPNRNAVFKRIGTLTGCRIEGSDLDVTVKGDSEQNVNTAIDKLNNQDRTLHAQLTFPHVFGFPILEGKVDIMLRLVRLGDLKDGRSATSLPASTTRTVEDTLVVVMVEGGRVVKVDRKPHRAYGVSLWKEHPYKEFNPQSSEEFDIPQAKINNQTIDKTMITNQAVDKKFATATGRYVLEQNPLEYVDAFSVPDILQPQENETSRNTDVPKTAPKRARAPRGAIKDTSATAPSLGPVDQAVVPKIEPPYIPPAPRSSVSDTPDVREWDKHLVLEANKGQLIDIEEKPPTTTDKKVFKHTMGQKSPQHRITGNRTNMLKDFAKAASHLLSLVRDWCGPVRMEVGIGRLLVTSSLTASDATFRNPFPVNSWPSVFPYKGNGDFTKATMFTPKLPTCASEVESILDLKLAKGRRLFEDKVLERSTTYLITCLTKSNQELLVEVQEDGSFELRGCDILAGAIDWYYAKRSWDSRLQVLIQENVSLLANYDQYAQEIVENMHTRFLPEAKTIQLSVITTSDQLEIKSVHLRRKTLHPVTIYPDLQLQLDEVQDMSVQETTKQHYQGTIHEPARMIAVGRYWWEVSISSIHARQILSENNTLELGEAAKWSAESVLSRGVISDMYTLADEIVTRIDHVGGYRNSLKSTDKALVRSRSSPLTSHQGQTSSLSSIW